MSENKHILYRYGKALNTHDLLKIVGTLFMIMDHVGLYALDNDLLWRLFGRGAAPIFFFLVGFAGKVHLSAPLIIYGVILSFTGGWLGQHVWINILLLFVLIHFTFRYFPLERLSSTQRLASFATLALITPFIYSYAEYGLLGWLIAYSGRSIALQERSRYYWLGASMLYYAGIQALAFGYWKNSVYLGILIGLLGSLYLAFAFFKIRSLSLPMGLRFPGLVIARYSLPIYFYHVIFFQIWIFRLYF